MQEMQSLVVVFLVFFMKYIELMYLGGIDLF